MTQKIIQNKKVAVIGKVFTELKDAKKYAKKMGGRRIIYSPTIDNKYLVILIPIPPLLRGKHLTKTLSPVIYTIMLATFLSI